ncbi:MAG: hypothetical protein DDT42_01810 [candidate division WS2 bacterium]|uniref:Uncharacterized protein n=1 Tax=Psychracetigena formicireducens TaxID=2986056 RepID=A0A9E2F2P8_PSYF1|nr:hypothetical protein [Candidatus Psychracetigena formicireducens]
MVALISTGTSINPLMNKLQPFASRLNLNPPTRILLASMTSILSSFISCAMASFFSAVANSSTVPVLDVIADILASASFSFATSSFISFVVNPFTALPGSNGSCILTRPLPVFMISRIGVTSIEGGRSVGSYRGTLTSTVSPSIILTTLTFSYSEPFHHQTLSPIFMGKSGELVRYLGETISGFLPITSLMVFSMKSLPRSACICLTTSTACSAASFILSALGKSKTLKPV